MKTNVEYNNNIFSLKGKLSRSGYIFQNLLINVLGFRFLYFPALVESFHKIKMQPDYKYLIQQLSMNPNIDFVIKALDQSPKQSFMIIAIKYLLIIPFRMIDIKRIKDLVDRELTTREIMIIGVVFTLPYVDFFTTLGLSILPALYYAKKRSLEKMKKNDLSEAQNEDFLQINKKLFESGKISRADYIKARNDHNKKLQ